MAVALLVFSLLLTTSYAVPVLDAQGNELKRGSKYFVRPAIDGPVGGGLKLVPRDGTCPLYVAREESEEATGLPVMFFPEHGAIIEEGDRLYAMFAVPTECPESTVWQHEEGTVMTGGTVSSILGPHFSRFAIRRSEDFPEYAYKIESCPCIVCFRGCSEADPILNSVVFWRADVEEPVILSKT